jgi:hypothetical protein
MQEEPCTKEHLYATVTTSERWSIDENGRLNEYEQTYESGNQRGDFYIESFRCDNCDFEAFAGHDPDGNDVTKAWQAALAHLPKQEEA